MITSTEFVEDHKGYKIHKVCYQIKASDQVKKDSAEFCRFMVSGGKLMRDMPFETLESAREGIDTKLEA